jgi:ketosteroid isomerase-like protein
VAGELEDAVRSLFEALDTSDVDAGMRMLANDAQGIDEISRRWMRGDAEVRAYVSDLMKQATDVHSEINDLHEKQWGDVGVVTCWLEQDYTFNGERVHVSAPTSMVLRREQDGWKFALFHSLPLPPDS